jgi:hypothetical protein
MNTPSPPPVNPDFTRAFPFLMPEAFASILRLFKIDDPEFGPPDLLQAFGPDVFDKNFGAYYVAFGFKPVFAHRPFCRNAEQQKVPLIERKIVHQWLRKYVAGCPTEFWNRLNILLRDVPALLDPMTEEPFVHKIIPRSCFPAEGSIPGALEAVIKGIEEYKVQSEKIVAEAKPLQNQMSMAQQTQAAQIAYKNQVMLAKQQKEHFRDMLGGWKKNAYGQDEYVEGWM